MEAFFAALRRIPRGVYVRLEVEDESGTLSASVWSAAPEDTGWPESWVHPADRHADRIMFSISTPWGDSHLMRMITAAIAQRWP